ncbi:hypothetical protein BRD17_10200 [Halobacteriales archaeon SW_7_68_16]|nr:MAG: hypothetical protein BRD17_10200 [Halobacteriales archaeon SW_7_68_16]
MDKAALREYVERASSTVDSSPDLSGRNTDLRLVQPFLDALGWDVHGGDVRAEYDTGAGVVDYALLTDDRPAVLVDAVALETTASVDDVDALAGAMRAAGVDWGLVTDGHRYAFLAAGGAGIERVECTLAGLPDRHAVVSHYTRGAADDRVPESADRRRDGADALAGDREAVVADLTDRLVEATDPTLRSELVDATAAFVADLVTVMGDGKRPVPAGPTAADVPTDDADADEATVPADDESAAVDDGATDESTGSLGGTADAAIADGTVTAGNATDSSSGRDELQGDNGGGLISRRTSTDRQYVARFFDGRSSVGAIGHADPDEAMAQAVRYLNDRHALVNRLSLPWGPDDDRAVLAREPTHPDGTPMTDAVGLGDGVYLCAEFNDDGRRTVVSELAGRAGLRVMFQGDWAEA